MRRLAMVAALILLPAVPCLYAQHHGGGFGGGMRVAPSFSRAGISAQHSFITTAPHNNGVHIVTAFPHHHHGYYRYRYPYYPYYGYGYWYDPGLWGSASSYDSPDAYYEQNQQLSQQINELSNEVARLREDQEARAYAAPPPQPPAAPAKAEPAVSTVLVFQDRHREEIQNYAVVGHTLWVFNQDRARKIPLAQLDLPATSKANDERGVDFSVPR